MKANFDKGFCFIFILTLSSIVSLRGQTSDTQKYFDIFRKIGNYNLFNIKDFYFDTGLEIGFGWYSYIISCFSTSSFLLFFPIALSIFCLIYKISIRCNSNLFFTLLLYVSSGYFAIWQFMQIRQGISAVLALYGVIFLLKEHKNYLYFIFLGVSSLLFHQSSILLLFLGGVSAFFLNKNSFSLNIFKLSILCSVLFFIFLSKFLILDLLINNSTRVSEYSNSEFSESEGIFRLPNIKAMLLFVFFFISFTSKKYKNKVISLFFILFSFSLAFRIGFSEFGILSGRLSSMFGFVEIFLFPIFINRHVLIGKIVLLFYIAIQFFVTYNFQVPDLFNSYFIPLE